MSDFEFQSMGGQYDTLAGRPILLSNQPVQVTDRTYPCTTARKVEPDSENGLSNQDSASIVDGYHSSNRKTKKNYLKGELNTITQVHSIEEGTPENDSARKTSSVSQPTAEKNRADDDLDINQILD